MAEQDVTSGRGFHGVLVWEGRTTSDKRTIDPNEVAWREPPLTLMVMTKASHGGAPTTETVPGGVITGIERGEPADDGAVPITYTGHFLPGPVGDDAASLVDSKAMRGISIDFAADEHLEVLAEDEDGFPTDALTHYSSVEIGMATLCPFPAFADCYIELDEPLTEPSADPGDVIDVAASTGLPTLRATPCEACGSGDRGGLVASGGPVAPPPAWFEDPQLDRLTALTVDDDGRVYGHLAPWGTCHIGIAGQCVVAPRSSSSYAHFLVGQTRLADGSRVATGSLFMGTAHADTRPGMRVSAVQDHYADTGRGTADVRVGEDAHGIWVAGALRPGLTEEEVRVVRATPLSGDWRAIGGRLELVAALHCNVPGFPVPRAELVASGGQPVALVAAGARTMSKLAEHPAGLDVDALIRRAVDETVDRLERPRRAAALAELDAALTADRKARETALLAELDRSLAAPPVPPTKPAPDPAGDGGMMSPEDMDALAALAGHAATGHDLAEGMTPEHPGVAELAQSVAEHSAAVGSAAQHLADGGTADAAPDGESGPAKPKGKPAAGSAAALLLARARLGVTRRTLLRGGNPVGTERLMEYWSHGKGAAKVGWGTPGDFDRCVRELGKYVGPGVVKGLCSNLHQRAIGVRPGQES